MDVNGSILTQQKSAVSVPAPEMFQTKSASLFPHEITKKCLTRCNISLFGHGFEMKALHVAFLAEKVALDWVKLCGA